MSEGGRDRLREVQYRGAALQRVAGSQPTLRLQPALVSLSVWLRSADANPPHASGLPRPAAALAGGVGAPCHLAGGLALEEEEEAEIR